MRILHASRLRHCASFLAATALPQLATAAVTTYGTYEEWVANAGNTTAMNFVDTGLPSGTFLTDQFVESGIAFREDDWVQLANADVGVPDQWFIQNFNADFNMWIDFTEPITAVAVDTIQSAQSYQLWLGDELVADLPQTVLTFNGFVSEEPFDAIRIRNEASQQLIVDNLFYSTIIPGPSGVAVLGVASLIGCGRRRR